MRALPLLLLLLLPLQVCIRAQISDPSSIDKNNKFRSREATDDLLGFANLDEQALANSQCPRNIELRWQAEVSSSIYATPLIADINSDGKLDIVVPGFVHSLDVLEGADGEKLPGWPASHQSTVHSSPLLYDIDNDGTREILLPTYNGEIHVFRSSGFVSFDKEKLAVPRLRVKKNWFVGLSPEYTDRSHPDVHDDGLIPPAPPAEDSNKSPPSQDVGASNSTSQEGSSSNLTTQGNSAKVSENATISPPAKSDSNSGARVDEQVPEVGYAGNKTHSYRRLLEAENNEIHEDGTAGLTDQEDGLENMYDYDYDDLEEFDDSMWGDEDFQPAHVKEEDYIDVDAHILCTPVIADIDGDGVDELVVAASYFFDREYYNETAHNDELKGIDTSKYIAGGIVVFDLQTKQLKWKTHLDMSMDTLAFRAYIYSAPTVADLDGNGKLSIIVGTSFGFVYAFNHDGTIRENFPLQMGEIQAQVVVGDVNDDGKLEIVTADTRGNVAVWTPQGKELWEVHLKSLIPQAPTIGDVDGDGKTDIVVPTVSGKIYVLRGKDGSFLPNFPFATHGRVMAPVLPVNLNKDAKQPQLTLVATSFDGYLYLIDGKTGCADSVDLGETSYTMVLAENVDGGDDLDLIVSTMNGNVYCYQTPVAHHPLKAWPMPSHGRNGFSSRYNREGIFVSPSSRAFRDESGKSFWVNFKIVDQLGLQGPYNVTVTLLVPGNYQGPRRIPVSKVYTEPGTYSMEIPCVQMRTAGSVSVEMVDKHGLYFSDEFSLTFHMHYHRLLKWMILTPMLAMLLAVVWLHPADADLGSLPFSNRHHSSIL